MYTQCPECEIAFKVTADVLKQAAGKVRCGGCSHAFNALSYLSEEMPKRATAPSVEDVLPELKPEIIDTDDGLPKSISAEQSAALLKTLDELAGSNIRIEDTGVEWRVLDDEEDAEPDADGDAVADVDDDAGPDVVDDDDAGPDIDADADDNDNDLDASADSTAVDELRFDDDTPLPENFDADDETPEAPRQVAEDDGGDAAIDALPDEPAPEITLSEPDEWTDILDEFQELAAEVAAPIDVEIDAEDDIDDGQVLVDDDLDDEEPDAESSSEQPMDMDSQFALQAEAMGIDLSGVTEFEEEPEADTDEELGQLELISPEGEQEGLIEEPVVESHTIEDELAMLDDVLLPVETAEIDISDEHDTDHEIHADNDSDEHFVPPMTEEEQTVNMQIDQDLMALAIEDEDGFASTIVMPEEGAEEKTHGNDGALAADANPDVIENRPGFETIIMEGEFVRNALENEKPSPTSSANLDFLTRERETQQFKKSSGGGVIAGVVVLVLLLAGQVIHQSREALATIPAFSDTLGQIYRAMGQPVQPAWNIAGWRFEATKGTAEGDTDELTVYSRLGNNSDAPLPYPIIAISLTDRFEDTIGSRMLNPVDYLPTNLDPRKLVEPGDTFNAVIIIKSTTADATGFKLNVCYRLSDEQLRCAIDDFL